jgi:hypothetical protein
MSTLDLTPLLKSPRLPEIAAALNDCLHTESLNRQRFYDEMTDGEKVEFIEGEVIMHYLSSTPLPATVIGESHITVDLPPIA